MAALVMTERNCRRGHVEDSRPEFSEDGTARVLSFDLPLSNLSPAIIHTLNC